MAGDRVAQVCKLDPDLLSRVERSEAHRAAEELLSETVEIGAHDELPRFARADERVPAVGLLVLEGVLFRRVSVGEKGSRELLGIGDLIRPWQGDEDFVSVPARASWEVLEDCRLAVLDARFERASARWPEIQTELSARSVRRANSAALLAALSRLDTPVERIEVLLWHLSDRWGRRRREGVLLPLELPQRSLGELVGISRQSVNGALSQLERSGRLTRQVGAGFLLYGPPPAEHEDLLVPGRAGR